MEKTDVFEFYEILALILPGAVMLYGISKLFPELMLFSLGKDFSVGEFGVFVIIAYATGHIVQVFGGMVEYIWRLVRGDPTQWLQEEKKAVLLGHQTNILEEKISKYLGIPREEFHIKDLTRKEWLNMKKQLQIAVEIGGHTAHLDKFLAIYTMCRGLIAALVLLGISSFFILKPSLWYISYILFILAAILLYRMARFERYSIRELFIQFLQLPIHTKER